MTTTATLKSLPKGEFVRRKPDARKTYKRGDYDRSTKQYALIDCDDINRAIYLKGSALVYIGFTY